jgi:hypothetical protein
VNARVVAAWQQALAAEHRAVFGYGVLGPHCAGAALDLARSCADGHQGVRDRTEAAIGAAGGTPVPANADYPDLYRATDGRSAARLAADLEDGCAQAWRYVYAVAAGTASGTAARPDAQQALTESAVRALRWRRIAGIVPISVPFPGIPS